MIPYGKWHFIAVSWNTAINGYPVPFYLLTVITIITNMSIYYAIHAIHIMQLHAVWTDKTAGLTATAARHVMPPPNSQTVFLLSMKQHKNTLLHRLLSHDNSSRIQWKTANNQHDIICTSVQAVNIECEDVKQTQRVDSLWQLSYYVMQCGTKQTSPTAHFSPSRNTSRLIYLVCLFRARIDCVKCPCTSLGCLRCYNFVKLHYITWTD